MFYSLYLKYLKDKDKRPGQITYRDPVTDEDYCQALTEAIEYSKCIKIFHTKHIKQKNVYNKTQQNLNKHAQLRQRKNLHDLE